MERGSCTSEPHRKNNQGGEEGQLTWEETKITQNSMQTEIEKAEKEANFYWGEGLT